MPCANADGSQKILLKIIGNAQRPRVFKNHSSREHGFDYDANKKAWMDTEIFFSFAAFVR